MNPGKKRFGQGNDVDRARPHIFHRDYWPLKLIHEEVTRFFEEHASSLHSKRVVDLGSGDFPYARIAAVGDARLIAADINPTYRSVRHSDRPRHRPHCFG